MMIKMQEYEDDLEIAIFDDCVLEVETVENYIPGRNVREISDNHLQNARLRAWRKLRELVLTQPVSGNLTPFKVKQKRFYEIMYLTCTKEVYRRFMRPNLISIPFANPQPFTKLKNEKIKEFLELPH